MIKRILCLMLALITVFTLVACTNKNPNTDDTGSDTETETDTQSSEKLIPMNNSEEIFYHVVLPSSGSTGVAAASTTLLDVFKDNFGSRPTRVYDNTEKNPEIDKEILLGLTNREESTDAMKSLKAGEFIVQQKGDKIVVLGANDYALIKGVEALVAALVVKGNVISFPENINLRESVLDEQIPVLVDGAFRYQIVVEPGLDDDAQDAISSFAKKLENLFDVDRITPRTDNMVEVTEGSYEILIGNTNRQESADALGAMVAPGYRLTSDGTKIILTATSTDMLCRGIDALYKEFKTAKDGSLVGECLLSNTIAIETGSSFASAAWFKTVPTLTGGKLVSGYGGDNYSCVIERGEMTVENFNEYVRTLESAGFTGGEDYELGGNRYALRYGSKATVYVTYSATAECIRIYAEQKNHFVYPKKDQQGTTNKYEPKMWQLRVDNINSRANGGMSYVWLLADGTFLVIDGGYQTGLEAKNLYEFLKAKNPNSGKPVIRAWYFSHTHGDHIGAIQAFANTYAGAVDVMSFYYHFENSIPSGFKNATAQWPSAVHYARIHTGMQVQFPGITMNVIYTVEDLYPAYPENGNDLSAVIRIDVKGQRVMFLGDIQKQASNGMLRLMGNDILKSDIVQFSHHGYEGATLKVYMAIDAATVLWPLNYVSTQASYGSICNVFAKWYSKGTGGEGAMANYYISHQSSCKQIIVAGGSASQELTFPYTPTPYANGQSGTNGRLPNINEVYNSIYDDLIPDGYVFKKE